MGLIYSSYMVRFAFGALYPSFSVYIISVCHYSKIGVIAQLTSD